MIDLDKRLKELPGIVDSALGGISADSSLKYKILSSTNQATRKNERSFSRFSIALTSISTCLIVLAVSLAAYPNLLSQKTVPVAPPNNILIEHSAAGHTDGSANSQTRALLTIPQSSMDISAGANSNVNSFWASGGDNFPLISINGEYYRQINGMDVANLRGESLGAVEEYTEEPALSSSGKVISNIASLGTEVYSVSGLFGGLVAAEVNGTISPFQRVSFAGNAIYDGENLQSTLGFSSSDVQSVQLSGVGSISDSAKAQELVSLLLNNASYVSPSLGSGSQILQINLKNGAALQMYADDDVYSACGSWSCPDFSQAFANALSQ